MSLGELPAAVLDVVVECAGFGHGWRLAVALPSLRATSMECAATRLGKCRWMGGDRAGTEFKPCWRHVAVALRHCPYYLLRPGGFGQTHLRFDPSGAMMTILSGVPRNVADKFRVKPTGAGEGTIEITNRGDFRGGLAMYEPGYYSEQFLSVYSSPSRLRWLLHLGSNASHLPFRRAHTDTGAVRRVLRARDRNHAEYQVAHWELAPATLAADERSEWRV